MYIGFIKDKEKLMIFDHLANFKNYSSLFLHFREIAEFLAIKNIRFLNIGKHELADHGAFALVSEYFTKPETEHFIECHQKYVDIQIVVSGIEAISFCNKSNCKELPYNSEKDFQKLEGKLNFVTMEPGMFAVFFPADGHMPGLHFNNTPQKVKKIVIKVPV
jgi:YhcH/YjgK/YiaL family protein